MAFPTFRLASCLAAGAATAAIVAGGAGASATKDPGLEPCRDLDIPANPMERVTCTTPNAVLVIAHQSVPVLLDGTEVRVLSATLEGTTAWVRLRVRNTTDAEQGINAGGQELYLYLAGERIDLASLRVVRLAVNEAKTVTLDYELTPDQLAALAANEGRLDFGVRPWHDGFAPAPLIGVVRVGISSF